MPFHSTPASPKWSRSSSSSSFSSSSTDSRLARGYASQQPVKLQSRVRSKFNELFHKYGQANERTSDKNKASQKPPVKEAPKPVDVQLHTQQRAVKRAGFNYLVECKMTMIEHQRQQEERFRKMIEEEEIRMLRKEMVPRAQLMPLFNRPFLPQRSTRPLTVPREPSFHSKSWRCMPSSEDYNFQRLNEQSSKPVK